MNIVATIRMEPNTTTPIDKSSSVRSGFFRSAAPGRIVLKPAISAFAIVGTVFSSVINPAAATAPAPIGRM
jgi:hypothetical protein